MPDSSAQDLFDETFCDLPLTVGHMPHLQAQLRCAPALAPPPVSMCLPVDASESSTPARVPVEETDRQAFLEVLHNQKITSVLQPIVSLRDGAVFGYEALGRGPAGTLLENPETLIQCALENGCMWWQRHPGR
jgi:FOG: EAL domain